MNFNDFLKDELATARLYNIQEVKQSIKEKWVQDKIYNHCERYNNMFTYEDIETAILNNDIVASLFAKDPLKQNLTEKICAKWIGIDKLPASGKNCVRFTHTGEITSINKPNVSKSADFYKDGVYYTQKYTGNNTGGAQDNQYKDVIEFLTNGSISHKVGAIVDGEYWTELGHKQMLKDYFKDNSNVMIVSADDIKYGY